MLSLNTILQGRYRIIRELGKGGMGVVYEAIDERLNSLVAVKETVIEDDEKRRSFEREASLLANLRHPFLPKVIDHFIEGDGQYFVMEFIQGSDLAQLLMLRGNAFSQEEVLHWGDDILNALEYLHKHSPPIVHRDVKPSNLKLTAEGELFLLDFGLAKGSTGQMLTIHTSRSVHGYTPAYAPLEQIHGVGTDVRSDIYSLGATLYHLLSGVTPIDAPTRFNALENGHDDPLRPANEVNPLIPTKVAAILQRAMAVSRAQRYSDASEMRQALSELSSPLPHSVKARGRFKSETTKFSSKSVNKPTRRLQWLKWGIAGVIMLTLISILAAFVINRPSNQTNVPNSSKAADSSKKVDPSVILAELVSIEKEMMEANLKADKDKLEPILADEYIAIAPDGKMYDKGRTLASTVSADTTVESWSIDGARLLNYSEDRAVLSYITTFKFKDPESPMAEQIQYIDMFIKRDGRWQMQTSQSVVLNQQELFNKNKKNQTSNTVNQ